MANKTTEKMLYKQLEQEASQAYAQADESTKEKIDAYRQSIYNYLDADPLTNRDARRLFIDAYKRMISIANGEQGYDPTKLGYANTNRFGYYNNEEVSNIGNQIAYKLFHQATPQSTTQTYSTVQPTTTTVSTTSGVVPHYNFVWNTGIMNPDYFTSTTTKKQKAEFFIDALYKNLLEAQSKYKTHSVHGLSGLTEDDIVSGLATLQKAKMANWDNPDEATQTTFTELSKLASKLSIPVDEFAQYFDLEEQVNPEVSARQEKLKQLKLTDVTDLDEATKAYLKQNGWQALRGEDNVARLYTEDFTPVTTTHSYIDDNPNNPNKFAFFVLNDGRYLSIPNLTANYDKNPETNPFAVQIGDEITRLNDSHNVFGKGIEYTYNPYMQYYHQMGETIDDSIQKLADEVRSQENRDYSFVDVSRFFGGDNPIIAVLPENEKLEYDMFGNPILPDNNYYYYDKASKTIYKTTKAYLNTKFGYQYNGYGNEADRKSIGLDLAENLYKHVNDIDTREFHNNDNMYGTTFMSRWFAGKGKDATRDIGEDPAGWAKQIIGFILDPNQEFIMGKKRVTGRWVLNELKYSGNELKFIQGLYAFINKNKLEDKIGKDLMRKLFTKYNELFNSSSNQVVTAQQGTVITPQGTAVTNSEKPVLKEKTVLPGEEKADGSYGLAITSLALDVVSLVSSFIPGAGSIVSLLSGIGSTAAQLAGDIKSDGLDFGDVGRFTTNVALDAIGIVGGAGKVAKIAKNIGAYAPVLLGLFHGISNGQQYADIVQKISSGRDLSVNEWMTLAQGLSLVTHVGRGAKELSKYKKISEMRGMVKGGASNDIKVKLPVSKNGKDVEVEVSLKDLEKAQKAKGKAEVKEVTDKKGKVKTPAQEATTDKEEALAIIRQATGDSEITFRTPKESKFNILRPSTWTKANRADALSKNPLSDIDTSSLPQIGKVNQSDIDKAAEQIAAYERFRFVRTKKSGGKLQRLQTYINNH